MSGESHSPAPRTDEPATSSDSNDARSLLLTYARTRSDAAFAAFVAGHLDLVYSTALRSVGGDVHLAQDVAQEVFVLVARRAALLAQHDAVEGWLHTTTRFEASHAVRREQRRRLREARAQLMNERDVDPEHDWSQVRPLLDDALANLNERDRQAVIMRFFLRRSFREISDRLQLTEDAARRRVERALDKLQGLLARRGVSSTSTALAGVLSTHAVGAAPTGLAATVSTGATASAAGATATAFNLLQLMATSKTAATVAVALILVAAGTAVHELDARSRLETTLSLSERQLDARQRQRADLQAQLSAADESAASSAASAGPDAAAPAPPDATAATPAAGDPRAAGDRFLAEHPEARKFWDERARTMALAKSGPMFRQFGLTPQQTDAMLDLILRQETRDTTLRDNAYVLHADPSLTPADFESEARQILGAKFDAIPNYLRQTQAYDLVAELAGSVYRTDPLQPGQIDRIAQVLTDASPTYQAGQAFNRWNIDWDRALTQAHPVLSATQWEALSNLRSQAAYRGARESSGHPATPKP